MSNTVITNYTDLNGPSTKAESSVVVIVNKDGSLSVDQNLLGTLMGTDGSQGAGISVVRVGHEGKPDDATDSESDDDKVPHVTMSVDSYYDEPNSIIKYDSGAEMLQSLRIETRENSLLGFQNDHCYTLLTSPTQNAPNSSKNFRSFDEPVIEIKHTPPPKPAVSSNKKITILEQQIIPKGKKIILHPTEPSIILKGSDLLNKPLPIISKNKQPVVDEKQTEKSDDSSSVSSSGESIPDRDSDSDYKDAKDRSAPLKTKKTKPRILKAVQSSKVSKLEPKAVQRIKSNKHILQREIKEKLQKQMMLEKKQLEMNISKEATLSSDMEIDPSKGSKHTPKIIRKEKKTPSHVTALLTDMTSLFSSPDVIRRVSTDSKPSKPDKEPQQITIAPKMLEINEGKIENPHENNDKFKMTSKTYSKPKPSTQPSKGYELIPQLDDASLAQILDNTSSIPKTQPSVTPTATFSSPGLSGPLSPPTLDLLAGLQPEEEGLTEDLLMHVAQLVESSENLQEVIDKQVLGKVDTLTSKAPIQSQPATQLTDLQTAGSLYTPPKSIKNVIPRKEPIEIVRRDGRVITLPPIEAPATRSSKKKTQIETSSPEAVSVAITTPMYTELTTPETQAQTQQIAKQYSNKKAAVKKLEVVEQPSPVAEKLFTESQESWNSEDDPYRLWCICKQPHNNRFMICCDSCEDWFHGKCVNITKVMGQQMEEQGIEWRCPNCVKKTKGAAAKTPNKPIQRKSENEPVTPTQSSSSVSVKDSSKTTCIVCKKPARASSIYCSDACILKHAQDSLSHNVPTKIDSETGKPQEKTRLDSRVIVYERKSGRLLAGPNAPTAENLKAWLQKNPTFEVVRPGTLSTIKPLLKKKGLNEPGKVQTTLNFHKIPKRPNQQTDQVVPKTPEPKTPIPKTPQSERSQKMVKSITSPPPTPQSKTPVYTRSQTLNLPETPKQSTAKIDNAKPGTSKAQDTSKMLPLKLIDASKPGPSRLLDIPRPSTSKAAVEQKKPVRSASRSQSQFEKASAVSPSTSRRKEAHENRRMDSTEPIRDNVRKAIQEQITSRMSETKGAKFTEDEIIQFANETELELYELFSKDVGMKYKAKYRSLMFNIKDRKNQSLWQKICDHDITPKQLVRLSPEELASQELAQWRAKEEKHQLELIKKSELDLLAANKTYVLKTHKGEEVMETKESVSTELDPNVTVENLVTALNESTGVQVDEVINDDSSQDQSKPTKKSGKSDKKHTRSKKDTSRSKKHKESERDSDKRKSRSRRSDVKEQTRTSTRRSERKKSSSRSTSKDRSKDMKEKTDSSDRSSRHRSRSRLKSRRRSKSRSRSASQDRDSLRARGRSRRRSSSRNKRKRSHSKRRSVDESKVRSKSQEAVKSKNDSPDSESVERPKSAMQKEVHPEYDPHEPMITSAFSEEDLRKDSFEENYKVDIGSFADGEFEPKTFSMDPILAPTKYLTKPDKLSEAESDQEPTSTVENAAATVWNGCINMVDVARFYVAAHEVSGNASELEDDLAAELDIVGRINPDTVWEYIKKMKRTSNKDIVVLRLQAANDEEQMQYIALYSYLSSRNRLGVVKVSNTATVKDFYIVPVPANTTLPQVLLPMDGPGLGEVKTHLLIAIIIRQTRKRPAAHLHKEVLPAKVSRESRKRSYTPPGVKSTFTPPSSPRRRALPIPSYTSPALSTSVKDKIAASLAAANDEDEPYSPGSSTSSGSSQLVPGSTVLRSKMEELNRQIEEQKQQILKMAGGTVHSVAEQEEAYSPSRPMTPTGAESASGGGAGGGGAGGGLADIALPSNLQEILATIQQRSAPPAADVDMRTLPHP